ncbi:MAG: 50S ribosomal protein L21 [Bacteroidia bacterium]|nr:50S ribosomal protein L21 [Bacteroidia bacterium]
MFAVVTIGGHQYKVSEGDEIFVDRLGQDEGSEVSFDQVLLVDNDGNTKVGAPTVKSASIKATVLEHAKADKVIVFKKKRRKGYKVKRGHRQQLSKIKVDSIKA